MVVPAVPFCVLLLVLLLIDDPKKPWSGIAYAAAILTVVGIGWAVRHWLIMLIPWLAFVITLVLAQDDEPEPNCSEFCISEADGYALLFFVLGLLLSAGAIAARLVVHLNKKRARGPSTGT